MIAKVSNTLPWPSYRLTMENLMYLKLKTSCEKGFSLIELSIVLVIVGLLMSAGVGIMTSVSKTSKKAKEKANLGIIKNSLISYALSRGKLPDKNCTTPPCELPFMDLNLSSVSKDTWSLPYGYDVTDILTTTNSDNLCSTLYQLNNLLNDEWYGGLANAPCETSGRVCVTNIQDDDNGRIDIAGRGYYLAAYIVSGGEDKTFGAKNKRDIRREYEMSSNPYDIDVGRDDLVGELSFGDLSAQLCTASNTKLSITITNGEVWLDNSGGCAPGTGVNTSIDVLLGQTLYLTSGCTDGNSFEELARCNWDRLLYGGTNNCVVGTPFDGKLTVDAISNTITQ